MVITPVDTTKADTAAYFKILFSFIRYTQDLEIKF